MFFAVPAGDSNSGLKPVFVIGTKSVVLRLQGEAVDSRARILPVLVKICTNCWGAHIPFSIPNPRATLRTAMNAVSPVDECWKPGWFLDIPGRIKRKAYRDQRNVVGNLNPCLRPGHGVPKADVIADYDRQRCTMTN